MNRYDNRIIMKNTSEKYKEYFKKRGVNFINHYVTPILKYPTDDQLSKMSFTSHTWTVGDRYWKLAVKHYKNPRYWWIIAWFNRKPTEAYIMAGDVIYIPTSLEQILEYLNV